MGRLWPAALCGAAALGSLYVFLHLPNVYARPLHVQYVGQTIDRIPVQIEVDGEYEVAYRVVKRSADDLSEPPKPPLKVNVTQEGVPIGELSNGSMWGAEDVAFAAWKFDARKGDTVLLSVRPHPDLEEFRGRAAWLELQRFPRDYALGMIREGVWACLTFALGLVTLGLAFGFVKKQRAGLSPA